MSGKPLDGPLCKPPSLPFPSPRQPRNKVPGVPLLASKLQPAKQKSKIAVVREDAVAPERENGFIVRYNMPDTISIV